MTQTALNTSFDLDTPYAWTLFSEVNCTFVNTGEIEIEVIGATSTPASDVRGIPYAPGQGEDASTDMLGRFPGAGTATGLYAIVRSTSETGRLFVSRAAVA